MIDYIKYTVDASTYELIDNRDGTWSKDLDAPSVVGNYNLLLEIGQNGTVTYIDSSDSRYEFYLDVIVTAERVVFLEDYVPFFTREIGEFKAIYDTENIELDKVLAEIEKIKSDIFIATASNEALTRRETFMGLKGQGSLEQRRSYLISLLQKSNTLSEDIIKNIANTITGSDCIIMFFGANELNNPEPGKSLLRVQVLSPDNNKNYRYEDIFRVLKPLVPAHIMLLVVKYLATWEDIKNNFADWNAVATMADWQAVKSYIPPQ